MFFKVRSFLIRLLGGKTMVLLNTRVNVPPTYSGLKQDFDLILSRCHFQGNSGEEFILTYNG